jgi:type 2 lantibiotic biosynthesis protein LanM
VQSRLLNPKCLRDGADFAIEADFLCRALTSSGERSRFWPLLAAELRALERGDIPFFATRADSDSLEIAPGQELPGCFLSAGVDQVRLRLRQLGAAHMEQQIALLRGTLYARTASAGPSAAEPAPLDDELPPATAEVLINEALAIAEDIRRRAILGPDRSASWIGLEYLGEAGRFQLQPMGPALYDGASGVALFLAALEYATGGAGYRDLALAGLQPLRVLLRALAAPAQHALAQQIGIGGASGVGGFVYALAGAGQLLGGEELLRDATHAAALITPTTIRADRSLDVVAGTAGAILGLLALHDRTGDAGLLERAHLCALHLLERRVPSAAGPRTWATRDGRMLTGFGHGAAGIAYALLRLHAAAPNQQLVAAAQEAIAYERSVFSAAAGNWPDLRASEDGAMSFMCGWCSGAPGIGLARLGGLPGLDTPEVRQDLAVATETALIGRQAVDHLCCGHAGRIELALMAGLRLGRPALVEQARRVAAGVLARARGNGRFSLVAGLPREVATPGLFQGTAGIGYTLLRLARPERVPSLLLWE